MITVLSRATTPFLEANADRTRSEITNLAERSM